MNQPAHPTRTMKHILPALFSLLFAVNAPAQEDWAAAREQFTAAMAKADEGAIAGKDSAELRGYVLYPYLEAARLQQQIKQMPSAETDSRVREFLESNAKSPATRELRRDWLQNLAQREDWAAFRPAYRQDVADTSLRCQQLLARIKAGSDPALREDASKVWMTAQKLPNTCIPAFDWMKQQGWLTTELLEQRARLALGAGNADLAESFLEGLPADSAGPLLRWARLIRTPQTELDALIKNPQEAVESPALLDGYARLARKEPEQALKIYPDLLKARKLKGDKAAPLTGALAVGLALNRMPEAVTYFQKIPEPVTDEKILEWRLRAALWNGQWKLVRDWSKRLPQSIATQDRWTYWHARALEQNKKTAKQANAIYQTLSLKNNLYGVLAAQRLGRPQIPQPQPQAANAELQKKLLQNPAIIRARELHLVGRDAWAATEWRLALPEYTTPLQLQAGLLASSWGWHSQAIPTLASVAVFDDFAVTYPLVYEPLVQQAAKQAGIAPGWVYGVMRQESLYDPQAVSPANAYGLLQLLLPTAKTVARKWKQSAPSREDLFKPEINLTLGAAYLRDMLDKWNGSLILALGSYNAGPVAVSRWLPDRPMDADIWIENVPFVETRGYIQKILWHICVFGWKETGQPQDLSSLLQPVSKPAS